MVDTTEANAQIQLAQQQIMGQQQSIAAAKSKLPEITGKGALAKYSGISGLQQRQQIDITKQAIQSQEQQVKRYEQDVKQYEQDVKQYEQQQKKQDLYQQGLQKGYEMGITGKYTGYYADAPAEFKSGLKAGQQAGAAEQARYGSPLTTIKYGTPSEVARARAELGIPKEATDLKWSKDYKTATYSLPDVGKIILGVGGIKGVESPTAGKTFTSVESYNKYVKELPINTQTNQYKTPDKITISLPYQTRGTAYYSSEKGFYAPTTTIEYNKANIKPFSEFIPIPGREKLTSYLLTPKTYMVEPGASTSMILATPEKIEQAKRMGEKPNFKEYKPGFGSYLVEGLVPKSVGEATIMTGFGLAAGGFSAIAPKIASAGFTGYGIYSAKKYVQAGTPEEKSAAAVGTLGLISSSYFAPKIKDIWITRGMKEIPAEKIVAPEVLEYYKTGKGTLFPYDKPKTFEKWFQTENIKKYGLPDIPKEVEGKPLGYSATSSGGVVEKTGIGEAGQFYSGKGLSIPFLRLAGQKGLLGQDYAFGNKPYVYALYGEGTRVVPSAYEIKVPNPYDVGGKPIKKYIFPNIKREPGIFYIPTNKPEVQAVTYGKIVPIRKKYYFNLGGRRVPIGEYVSDKGQIGEQLISSGIVSESSSSSVLPSKLTSPKLSLMGLSNIVKNISKPKYYIESTKSSSSIISNKVSSSVIIPKSKSYIPKEQIKYTPPKISSYISSIKEMSVSRIPTYTISSRVSNRNSYSPKPSKPKPSISEPPKLTYKSKLKLGAISEPETLSVFLRKFGKDIEVKKGISSREEAKNVLLGGLKSTLRASGYVQKSTGEKLKVSELGYLGREFGQSKREISRVVQARSARLGTRGETKEIQVFKKSNNRRGNLFGI